MTEEKLVRAQEILSKIKVLRSALRSSAGDPHFTRDLYLFSEACEIVIDDIVKILENKLCELETEFANL